MALEDELDTLEEGLDLSLGLTSGGGMLNGGDGITDNREGNFSRGSARFHDPVTGEFEAGSPPPDLDKDVNRYRAKNGRFKDRSADLFDEPLEVDLDSLEPEG